MKTGNTQQIVWITGASSGIGEALVYEYIKRGATVIASARQETVLLEVKSRCIFPENCHVQPLDLSESTNFPELTKKIIMQFGRIDILINNGGISQRSKAGETPLFLDRQIFETNYFGTIALTKAVLPYMLAQKGGVIAATSSIAGKFGFPLRSAYSASKFALHGFFESLRLEYFREHISVCMIIPGRVRTNISKNALEKDGSAHNKMDNGQAQGISPEKAARQIMKGLDKHKKEIPVGSTELLMLYFKRFFPALHFKIAANIKSS